MNFTPTNGRVVIAKPEVKSETDSGIYIPGSAQNERPSQGQILAMGQLNHAWIQVGHHIVFNKFAAQEIAIDGKTYYIIKEEEILGAFKNV